MRIIAFAETTEALLAGRKCVTRREWNDRYAATFKAGELLQAWDKNPRTRKGKRVATIRLTEAPVKERANQIMPSDWEDEGFAYMQAQGLTLFGGVDPEDVYRRWSRADDTMTLWVVRFELVSTAPRDTTQLELAAVAAGVMP